MLVSLLIIAGSLVIGVLIGKGIASLYDWQQRRKHRGQGFGV